MFAGSSIFAGAGVSTACCTAFSTRVSVASSTVDVSMPIRSSAMVPRSIAPFDFVPASAAAASGIALSALSEGRLPRIASAAGVACMNSPWPEKIASASSEPVSSRFACSASESFGPAASVATTRIAGVRSASMMRAQLQSSAPPKRPPNPRRRSSLGAAPCGSVPASRAICSAAEPLGSIVWPVSADGEAALKIAAAVGLPHRMRVASALHSHTGTWLVAYSASRGSLRNE